MVGLLTNNDLNAEVVDQLHDCHQLRITVNVIFLNIIYIKYRSYN
jgi:hypothetical protein